MPLTSASSKTALVAPAVVAAAVIASRVLPRLFVRWTGKAGPRLFSSDRELREATAQGIPTHKMNLKVPKGKAAAVVIACGSFSPPTTAHLRILEDAKNALEDQGIHVVGGFVSPVHQAYGKKSLVDMYHRANMMTVALHDSEWIAVDTWECAQDAWTRTALVMDRYQAELDRLHKEGSLTAPARALLLGGADLVESFKDIAPDGTRVWSLADIEKIVTKGMACITREGTDLDGILKGLDLLEKNKDNIKVVHPVGGAGISSTLVRKLLNKGASIKYIVHDAVIDYISEHRLDRLAPWQP